MKQTPLCILLLVVSMGILACAQDVLSYSNILCDKSGCFIGYADFCGQADTVPDGAITDAKITGPISGSKLGSHSHGGGDITSGTINPAQLPVGTTSGTIAAGNHTHYVKTIVVSPVGTDSQNGAALLSALAGISGNSASNPYLVKIEPGIYDIGSSYVQTKDYVDIEGSGENTTVITGSLVHNMYALVNCGNHAEVRSLSVRNQMGGTQNCGNMMALSLSSTSCKLSNVTATALDTFATPKCWTYGLGIDGSATSPVITNVKATGSGGTRNHGLYILFASPLMTNVMASASGGANALCEGIHNDHASPTMTNVRVLATGCGESYGVSNYSSSPVMQGMMISAKNGSTHSRGINNTGSGSPLIRDAFIEVDGTGGVYGDGVFSELSGATPELVNVSIKVSNATTNIGISSDAATVRIDHSVVRAATSVYNTNGATLQIGNSKLEGEFVILSGTIKCFNVYDLNYNPVVCP